jgi:hypothetical protein
VLFALPGCHFVLGGAYHLVKHCWMCFFPHQRELVTGEHRQKPRMRYCPLTGYFYCLVLGDVRQKC